MIAISIIMPVYNTKHELLRRAIESILAQSLKAIELILVDDGSINGSGDICDQYAAKDRRVVVIHQDNSGICLARNKAIEIAKGEYIGFCDHDDEYGCNQLLDNYNYAKEYGADVVKYNYEYICLDDAPKYPFEKNLSDGEVVVMDRNMLKKSYSKLRASGAFIFVWNGIYRSEFLRSNNCCFDEYFTIGQEDIDFNNLLVRHLNRMVYNPKSYYRHYRYEKSTSRGMDKEKSYKLIEAQKENFRREVELCNELGLDNRNMVKMRYRNLLYILSTMCRKDFKGGERFYIKVLNEVNDEFFVDGIRIKDARILKGVPNKLCVILFLTKQYKILKFCLWGYINLFLTER